MFFKKILNPVKYKNQTSQKYAFGMEPSKGTLFAERVWFGFMLIFAAPLILPFLLIGLINKLFSLIFGAKTEHKKQKYDFIYQDVSSEDTFISEEELDTIIEDKEPPEIDSEQVDVIADELNDALDSLLDDNAKNDSKSTD